MFYYLAWIDVLHDNVTIQNDNHIKVRKVLKKYLLKIEFLPSDTDLTSLRVECMGCSSITCRKIIIIDLCHCKIIKLRENRDKIYS